MFTFTRCWHEQYREGRFSKAGEFANKFKGGCEILLLGRNILGRYDKNRFEEQSTIPCSDSMH